MRILIASDTWHPQINGVVRTLGKLIDGLRVAGHEIHTLTPEGRRTIGMPTYPEIRLTWLSGKTVDREIKAFNPDRIHIATEGPVGSAVRRWCLKNNFPFCTSFHTRFAEYLSMRLPLPGISALSYGFLRRFHAPSRGVLAPTLNVTNDLLSRNFTNVKTWTRGVDHSLFRPVLPVDLGDVPRPVMINVGRVAVEKGLEDFLAADVPGTKVIIGDGPARKKLMEKYPTALFRGYKQGEELVREICAGDVFVFPSKTDTFGLVLLEAMACGLPVAAYPVMGPVDVVHHGFSGWLNNDIAVAIQHALTLDKQNAIDHSAKFTWARTVEIFLQNMSAPSSA